MGYGPALNNLTVVVSALFNSEADASSYNNWKFKNEFEYSAFSLDTKTKVLYTSYNYTLSKQMFGDINLDVSLKRTIKVDFKSDRKVFGIPVHFQNETID